METKNIITVFHGSVNEIETFRSHVIYATIHKTDALQYAKMVEVDGEMFADMNSECGHLYMATVDASQIEMEDDFDALDCGGYSNPDSWSMPVVMNEESGYMFIKDASKLNWVKIAA